MARKVKAPRVHFMAGDCTGTGERAEAAYSSVPIQRCAECRQLVAVYDGRLVAHQPATEAVEVRRTCGCVMRGRMVIERCTQAAELYQRANGLTNGTYGPGRKVHDSRSKERALAVDAAACLSLHLRAPAPAEVH